MMATATTTRSFTWSGQFRNEIIDCKPCGCNIKPARTIRPNGTFPKLTRSRSFGSPTFPRRKPSPIRRKAKSVHFADSKGLALVSVSTFNEEKELREQFAKFASLQSLSRHFKDSCKVKRGKETEHARKKPSEKIIKQLAWQKVCVENTELLKSGVRGYVYVANLAYDKQVKARYTFNSWRTQEEILGGFHSNCTKEIDKFVFEIPVPKESAAKNFKLEFAVSYTVLGDTFWDNNNGFNYHALFASS